MKRHELIIILSGNLCLCIILSGTGSNSVKYLYLDQVCDIDTYTVFHICGFVYKLYSYQICIPSVRGFISYW